MVIRNISVLDVKAGAWLPHLDLIIRNGRIAAVQPTGSPLPPAKVTINGDGKFAVPGFFDNRVHLKGFDRTTAGQFVAYGVTSVWDRGTDATTIEEWRRDISYGKFMGPRIVRADAAPRLQKEPALPGSGAGATSPLAVGFHDELAARVRRSGLTAGEVLRSATLDSAAFHGRGLDLGSIEPGKIADVIVLGGDPLADIAHTRTIDAVVFRGETLTRAHLNQLLSHASLQPARYEHSETLSRREREILDILYLKGSATAAEVREAMADPPSYSAVRALLRILEEKGHATHETEGTRYVYVPSVPRERARNSALSRIVKTFFDGSAAQAAAALVDSGSLVAGRAGAAVGADRTRAERRTVMDLELHRSDLGGARCGLRTRALLRHAAPSTRHLVWHLAIVIVLSRRSSVRSLPEFQLCQGSRGPRAGFSTAVPTVRVDTEL